MILYSEMEAKTDYINDFLENGVSIFKNNIDAKKIFLLTHEIQKIKKIVMTKVNMQTRPLKTYSDIAERHLGRLDYRCGFHAEIFNEVAEPISRLLQNISPQIDFNHYWGVITSLGESGPTNWHRDVYPILNNCQGENLSVFDLALPPYYFTVLIPLIKITREHGPTGFIKGSHRKKTVDEKQEEIYAPLLSPGDIAVFDGRTLHAGLPNTTQDERLIAYITYTAKWYHDQTFVMNDYLFPEWHHS